MDEVLLLIFEKKNKTGRSSCSDFDDLAMRFVTQTVQIAVTAELQVAHVAFEDLHIVGVNFAHISNGNRFRADRVAVIG